MEIPKNKIKKKKQTPTIIASNSRTPHPIFLVLLSLHRHTAAKGPFRFLRSTTHSLLTFLEDWRDNAEATSTWWNGWICLNMP